MQTESVSFLRLLPPAFPFLAASVLVPLMVTVLGVLLRRKNGAIESAFVDLYLFIAALQFSSVTLAGTLGLNRMETEQFIALLLVLGLITLGVSFAAVDLQTALENRHFQKRVSQTPTLRARPPVVVPKFPLLYWTAAWLGVYVLLTPTLFVLLTALRSQGNSP